MDYLQCLASRYSDRCETSDIGNSTEGRPIKVMKISSPTLDGTVKPAIWIDGGIHAREWISPSSVEYLVHQLVENFYLPQNKIMVDHFDIYVLPIMNPDGLVLHVHIYLIFIEISKLSIILRLQNTISSIIFTY